MGPSKVNDGGPKFPISNRSGIKFYMPWERVLGREENDVVFSIVFQSARILPRRQDCIAFNRRVHRLYEPGAIADQPSAAITYM